MKQFISAQSKPLTIKILLLGFLPLFLIFNISCGQINQSSEEVSAKISELLEVYSSNGDFNGSVLVADKGEVIYKGGFGYANMKWDIPNESNTKHRLASVTKQFTAMLILQLAAEGKLDLHKPISTYLPNYPSDKAEVISIHHLLTHSSGIPDYVRFPNYTELEKERYRPNDVVALFKDLDLEFEPGKIHNYCNSGYILLGVIIEEITGKPYGDVLDEKIFKPVGMTNTGYENQRSIVKKMASGYTKSWGTYFNVRYFDMSLVYAAGAMYSTVEDLFLWDRSLYTNKLLPQSYLDLMFEKYLTAGGGYYGYGWKLGIMYAGNSNKKLETAYHSGGTDGVRSYVLRIPDSQSYIVLLSNTETDALRQITNDITAILCDEDFDFPRRSLAYGLKNIIDEKGIETAESYYKENKDTDGFYIDEQEMVMVGYELKQSGQMDAALTVFKLSIEAFPDAYNTYDSYAETLKEMGRTNESIENYRKSVELNPGNQNGIKILKEMGQDVDDLLVKVPLEHLQTLEGQYKAAGKYNNDGESWILTIELENGELICSERNMQYTLIPVSQDEFVNQNYRATLQFNSTNSEALSLLYSGDIKFDKIN